MKNLRYSELYQELTLATQEHEKILFKKYPGTIKHKIMQCSP